MEAFEALIQQRCNACVFGTFDDYAVCMRISLSRSVKKYGVPAGLCNISIQTCRPVSS